MTYKVVKRDPLTSKRRGRDRPAIFYIQRMFKTLFKMTRPVNIVIAVVTLAVGYFLLGNFFGQGNPIGIAAFVLQSAGFAFAIGFGNIQNDVLDLESDKRNRPERPLVKGTISLKAARIAWISMAVLSIACGILDSALLCCDFIPALFFGLLVLLLNAYNRKLKHIPLLKNMTVAFLCATPLILNLFYPVGIRETEEGTMDFIMAAGTLSPAMLFAFLLTAAREIYKDLEDELGDLKAGIMTFPLIAGSTMACRFAGAIILFTWILLPLPVMQGFYPILFLILSAIALTPCFAIVLIQAHRKNYRMAQKLTKLSMFLGLIALMASVI